MAQITVDVPDNTTPLIHFFPNKYITKAQIAFGDESPATPAQAKQRIMALQRQVVIERLKQVDIDGFRATQEQYDEITGE